MKNGMAVGALARQLRSTAQRIEDLSKDIEMFEQGSEDMVNTCVDLRLDELERAQMLVLELTKLITEPAEGGEGETEAPVNQDEGGSVFGPGELTDNGGDKTQEDGTDPACSK